jgi:hypothetical protein
MLSAENKRETRDYEQKPNHVLKSCFVVRNAVIAPSHACSENVQGESANAAQAKAPERRGARNRVAQPATSFQNAGGPPPPAVEKRV